MEEIIAVVMGLSIPLSIIFGVIHLKSKKLSLRQFNTEERQVLLDLKSENAELRRRLEQLEISQGIQEEDMMQIEQMKELDTASRLELLAKKRKFS